jgi:hypothetical protein
LSDPKADSAEISEEGIGQERRKSKFEKMQVTLVFSDKRVKSEDKKSGSIIKMFFIKYWIEIFMQPNVF